MSRSRDDIITLYDRVIAGQNRYDRFGKSMPYTSANGHMFSQVNKDGQIGIRLPKSLQEVWRDTYGAEQFLSYGAKMKDYLTVPDKILEDEAALRSALDAAYDFIMTLPPK